MAKYKCIMCGYIYDDDKEDVKFEDLPEDWVCPMCFSPKSDFQKITEDDNKKEETKISKENNKNKVGESTTTVENYLKEYVRVSDDIEKNMDDIHKMAITGESIISAMGPNIKPIGFDDILILGGQLYNPPLLESDPVNLKTIVGKNAKDTQQTFKGLFAELNNAWYAGDEEKYLKFKEILPLVEERHENGEISESEYTDFIKKYQSLEGQYGWDY